ncbi:MAG TPA: (4Fe-4S)-binding protein [Fimbriimonadaceae bacterium]|nr:(4Fe-4S)-binding protein [Fimbriimonadaceae bacterium]
MNEEIKEYSNGEVTVVWNPALCIHSGRCVRGLPAVFDVKRRPWIDVMASDSESIVRQVGQCPSGALSIKPDVEESRGSR